MTEKSVLLEKLREIEVIKYGDFILKSGERSSIYIDLRHLISYPKILEHAAKIIAKQAEALTWDLLCGVPYNAIPLVTCLSLHQNKPMILRRKELKSYGTKKKIEGKYTQQQTCLVIEDVTTTGSSILETIEDLEKENLIVKDIIVLVERTLSARELLLKKGYQLHSVFKLEELIEKNYENAEI